MLLFSTILVAAVAETGVRKDTENVAGVIFNFEFLYSGLSSKGFEFLNSVYLHAVYEPAANESWKADDHYLWKCHIL